MNKIIKVDPNDFGKYKDWKDAKSDTASKLQGRNITVLAVKEKELPGWKVAGRACLGILATIGSIGIVWFIPKSRSTMQDLFKTSKKVILIPDPKKAKSESKKPIETPEPSLKDSDEIQLESKKAIKTLEPSDKEIKPEPVPQDDNPPVPVANPTVALPADAFGGKYKADQVWERFLTKHKAGFNAEQLAEIRDEAEGLKQFALQSSEAKDQIEEIKAQLTAKKAAIGGKDPTQEEIEGKVYALSLKVAAQLKNPTVILGWQFNPTVQSKAGVVKPTPAQRLLKANPIVYQINDQTGKTHRHGLLIIKKLGEGAYNQADLAYHMQMNQSLVLRQLKPTSLSQQASVAEWHQELQEHLDLQNRIPGLVKLHYYYTLDTANAPFTRGMALEVCSGDMEKFSKNGSEKLSELARISAFGQTLTSFSTLHRENKVHADIKPANILFKKMQNGMVETKVSDFGKVDWAQSKTGATGDIKYIPIDGFLWGNLGAAHRIYTDAWALGLSQYEIKYGAFTKHLPLNNQIIAVSTYCTNEFNEVRKFPDTTDNRKILVQRLANAYNLNPQAFPDYRNIDLANFHAQLYNHIIQTAYISQFEQIFRPVCNALLASGNKEDRIIAGLLEPDISKRWSTEGAARALNGFQTQPRESSFQNLWNDFDKQSDEAKTRADLIQKMANDLNFPQEAVENFNKSFLNVSKGNFKNELHNAAIYYAPLPDR